MLPAVPQRGQSVLQRASRPQALDTHAVAPAPTQPHEPGGSTLSLSREATTAVLPSPGLTSVTMQDKFNSMLRDRQKLLLSQALARQRFTQGGRLNDRRHLPVLVKGRDGQWHPRRRRRKRLRPGEQSARDSPAPDPFARFARQHTAASADSACPLLLAFTPRTPHPPPRRPAAGDGRAGSGPGSGRSAAGAPSVSPSETCPAPGSFEAALMRRARRQALLAKRHCEAAAKRVAELEAAELDRAIAEFTERHGDAAKKANRQNDRVHRAARGTLKVVARLLRSRNLILHNLRGGPYQELWRTVEARDALDLYCKAAGDKRYLLSFLAFEQVHQTLAHRRPDLMQRAVAQEPQVVARMFIAVDIDNDGRASLTEFLSAVALLRCDASTVRILDWFFICLVGSRAGLATESDLHYEHQLERVLHRTERVQQEQWEVFCQRVDSTAKRYLRPHSSWTFSELVEHLYQHYSERRWSLDHDLFGLKALDGPGSRRVLVPAPSQQALPPL